MDTLASIGVKRIYGVPGDSLNGITDAIRAQSIAWIHTRNEEAAAFAAGGEAHLTATLPVCAGICGPGNTRKANSVRRIYTFNAEDLEAFSELEVLTPEFRLRILQAHGKARKRPHKSGRLRG